MFHAATSVKPLFICSSTSVTWLGLDYRLFDEHLQQEWCRLRLLFGRNSISSSGNEVVHLSCDFYMSENLVIRIQYSSGRKIIGIGQFALSEGYTLQT